MDTFNQVMFYIVVFLCGFTLYKMFFQAEKVSAAAEKEVPEKWYYIVLAIISLIAVCVRVYEFGNVPGGMNQDGCMAAVDANALAHHGTDRLGMRLPVHLTAWGFGQMSALLSYLMVPFIKLFGVSVVVARLPQLLISLLGLVCLCFFCRDVFGRNASIAVYLFAAVNPWHILQSRWALDCNLYPHFFIFGIFFLNYALKVAHSRRYLCLSMIMFGLCMYCYGISIYTLPLFLVLACAYLLITKRIHILDAILSAAVYLAVAGPFILVMAINFFKWDTISTPLFTMPYFPDSVRSNDILFFSDNIMSQLGENLKSLAGITVQQTADLPWNNIPQFGTMYLFSIPFAVVGLVAVIRRYRKTPGAILALFFLLTGIWGGITTNYVNINRLNIIYYPIMILAGVGIFEVVRYIRIPCFYCGIVVTYLVAFGLFCNTYFTTWASDMKYYYFDDFCHAVSSLKESDYDKYYITTIVKENDDSPIVSELLSMLLLDIDAEYYRGVRTPDGEIPYQQKFTYASIPSVDSNSVENAVYVVPQTDLPYFDTSIYQFRQFGSYYVVTRIDGQASASE